MPRAFLHGGSQNDLSPFHGVISRGRDFSVRLYNRRRFLKINMKDRPRKPWDESLLRRYAAGRISAEYSVQCFAKTGAACDLESVLLIKG